MNATGIGLVIAKRRREAGLTQADLARLIGTTQSAISRVEAGRSLPSLEVIERIARATGKPITITIGGPPRRADRSARVRRALGDFRFDPWARDPSPAERRALRASGLKP